MKSVKILGSVIVEVSFDREPGTRHQIVDFINCPQCVEEIKEDGDVNLSDYSHLEIGVTDEGRIQVWCHLHQINVMLFRMESVKEDIDLIEEDDDDIEETIN